MGYCWILSSASVFTLMCGSQKMAAHSSLGLIIDVYAKCFILAGACFMSEEAKFVENGHGSV